jgi:hypothetical protein
LKETIQNSITNILGETGPQILEDPFYLNVEKRILKISIVIASLILATSLYWGSWKFIISFIVGSILSVLNFSWMKQGVDRMLQGFQSSEVAKSPSKKIIFKYFIRYSLIGGVLYAIFRYRFFDARAAFLGLFLVVMAVLYECLYQIIKSLFEDGTRGRT